MFGDLGEVRSLVVPWGSEHYWEAVELRQSILRRPLGIEIPPEQLENERSQDYYHLVCVNDGRVISVVGAQRKGQQVQIRQMATVEAFRGYGLGSRLLLFSENTIATLTGIRQFFLFSRLAATNFYRRAGYEFVNDEIYIVARLEHRQMSKLVG